MRMLSPVLVAIAVSASSSQASEGVHYFGAPQAEGTSVYGFDFSGWKWKSESPVFSAARTDILIWEDSGSMESGYVFADDILHTVSANAQYIVPHELNQATFRKIVEDEGKASQRRSDDLYEKSLSSRALSWSAPKSSTLERSFKERMKAWDTWSWGRYREVKSVTPKAFTSYYYTGTIGFRNKSEVLVARYSGYLDLGKNIQGKSDVLTRAIARTRDKIQRSFSRSDEWP